MATVTSLKSELARIRQAAGVTAPRQWNLILEEGEELPPVIAAKIRSDDRIFIRQWPRGFLSKGAMREGDWNYGYVHWHGGAAVIKPDGTLEKVRRQF